MPVVNGETALALSKEEGGYADDPILGVVENMDLGALSGAGGDLRRRAGRHDPVHRHQRRADRRVAADLLDGPVPPAARAAAHAAPEVPDAVRGDRRVRRRGLRGDRAGQGRLPRDDLRLRGDAVVHDGARLADRAADRCSPTPSGRGEAPATCGSAATSSPSSRCSAGWAPGSRLWSSRRSTCACSFRRCCGWCSASRSTSSTGAARACRSPRRSRSSLPKPVVEHEVEYESVLVAFEDGNFSPAGGGHRGPAGGAAAARHPRAGHDHRAAELADRRADPRAGGARRGGDRLRPACAADGA